MKKFIKGTIKFVAFLLVFINVFSVVSFVLVDRSDMDYQGIRGLYDERENSLDAVYIGSSNCLAYWNPVMAWEEYGISVYAHASNTQPFQAAEYLIKEARKTQKDAIFVVNINTLNDAKINYQQMHKLLDPMPFSLNKLALTKHFCELGEFTFDECLEFYFPIIRYHSRWSKLDLEDYTQEVNGLKGTIDFNPYFSRIQDITDSYIYTDKEAELTEGILESANSLLDYCEEEDVKILFVTVPQTRESYYDIEKYNALNKLIESRGFDTMSLIDDPEALGLNLETDFYNNHHTNIHGSVKFTYHISEFLVEKYGLENKRGNPEYADWENAYEMYRELSDPYFLDFEWSNDRNLNLSKPATFLLEQVDTCAKLYWSEVEGADGYKIYKKEGVNGKWQSIHTTEDIREFIDTDVKKGVKYFYTVVPFSVENDVNMYGYFNYSGRYITIE